MPRRKEPNPNATSGWDGEVRQEKINNQVASRINLGGKNAYDSAYHNAIEKIRDGMPLDEIRIALKRHSKRNPFQDPATARQEDLHEIHECTESELCRIHEQAVEDALAGKPPHYQPTNRY